MGGIYGFLLLYYCAFSYAMSKFITIYSGKTALLLTMLEELGINNFEYTKSTSGSGNTSPAPSNIGGSVMTFPKGLSIAYCSHDPWIVNASAKQNILIGNRIPLQAKYRNPTDAPVSILTSETITAMEDNMDRELYSRVVQACALQEDFAEWSHGEDTVIGERGITISGMIASAVLCCLISYDGLELLCTCNDVYYCFH